MSDLAEKIIEQLHGHSVADCRDALERAHLFIREQIEGTKVDKDCQIKRDLGAFGAKWEQASNA